MTFQSPLLLNLVSLRLLTVVAVLAIVTAGLIFFASPLPANAQDGNLPALDLSLESSAYSGHTSSVVWEITVRNNQIPGRPPLGAGDVVVRITATMNGQDHRATGNPISGGIFDGAFDANSGLWTITRIPPGGSAQVVFTPRLFVPSVQQTTPFRLHAELVGAGGSGESPPSPPPAGWSFDPDTRTGIWDVGHIAASGEIPVLSVPATVTAGDIPLEKRCLTATIVKALPAFDLDAQKQENDETTVCLGDDPPVVADEGEIILWWHHDCVGNTAIPCTGADELKLFARADHDEVTLSGAQRRDEFGRSTSTGVTYLDPEPVIVQVLDPAGRKYDDNNHSVTGPTTVSWQTGRKDSAAGYNHAGIRTWYSRTGFNDNIADWSNIVRTVSVRGVDDGAPPGLVKVRHDSSTASAFYNPAPPTYRHQRSPFNLTSTTSNHNDYFFEFEKLGTYIVNFHVLATRTDATEYEASGDYTFHVGPIAELAVWDGGASSLAGPKQRAYTIHAASKGPDTAPAIQVELTGVSQGAEAIVTDGTYTEGTCSARVCDGVWDLGELGVTTNRPVTGRLPHPTLTFITNATANPGDITASIENTEDYSTTIDGDVHSTNYFDYVEENDSATIAARPGTGEGTPGTPRGLEILTHPDSSFALVKWEEVKSVNRRPVTGYQVHESAPPCVRPAFDVPATDATITTVRGRLHLDTGPTSGEDTCYAVRAVNEQGVAGHWTFSPPPPPPSDATAPGALMPPQLTAGDGQVTASWDAPADGGSPITGYVAQLREFGQDWGDATEVWVFGTSFDFTGLTNGTIYSVRVRAVNAVGQSDWSLPSLAIPDVIPPSTSNPPTLIAGYGRIRVEWDGPSIIDDDSPFDHYDIRWKKQSAGWDRGTQVPFFGASNHHTIWGLTNETEYEVQVRGVNALGQGVWSASATATPVMPAPSVSGSSPSSLSVSWDAPDDAGPSVTGYGVRYREGASGSWSGHAHDGTGTATSITGLAAYTGYQVQVEAGYAGVSGGWSDRRLGPH